MAKRLVAGVVLAGCASPAAFAAQADLGFGIGTEYSDNITLAPDGSEEDGWVAVLASRLRVVEQSADSDLRVLGTLQYRDYHDVDFNDEFVLSMDANGYWTLSPGWLTWHVEDYFDQAAIDILAPTTPANRQDTNVLSTGPEARWRLSASQSLIAGARYGNYYFEKSNADSNRLAGYGRWQYAMNSRQDISANIEVTQADFTERSYGDYRRADAFLRFTNRWSRSTIQLDGGKTTIDRDKFANVDGFLGRAAWNIRFNSYSGLDAYTVHQYTDAGHDILQTSAQGSVFGPIDEQITGDVYYSRHSELAYHNGSDRIHWQIAGGVRDENYEVVPNDRRQEEGNFHFSYELTETLRAAISYFYRKSDYHELDQVDTDRNTGLHLSYQANSHLTASAEISHNDRDSTSPEFSYTENRIFLMLSYDRGPILEEAEADAALEGIHHVP